MWHDVHGFGILYWSVIAGVMNAKVWARTFTSAMVGLDRRHVARDALASGAAGLVMRVLLERAVRGPLGEPGPWHSRHIVGRLA